MITELCVPRSLLAEFLATAASDLRSLRANVVYGTVRLIERDEETVLAWAREPWACIVLNLHVEHNTSGIDEAVTAFRRLIDSALDLGGSFYLTYHRWATRPQLLTAYPQLPPSWRQSSSTIPKSSSGATGTAGSGRRSHSRRRHDPRPCSARFDTPWQRLAL